MAKGRTGTSMQGTIINTNKGIKAIPCDCSKCSHRRVKGAIKYCDYYDIFSPNKKKCVRYAGPTIKPMNIKKKKKKKNYGKNK